MRVVDTQDVGKLFILIPVPLFQTLGIQGFVAFFFF